jgi:hypothetical protein
LSGEPADPVEGDTNASQSVLNGGEPARSDAGKQLIVVAAVDGVSQSLDLVRNEPRERWFEWNRTDFDREAATGSARQARRIQAQSIGKVKQRRGASGQSSRRSELSPWTPISTDRGIRVAASRRRSRDSNSRFEQS